MENIEIEVFEHKIENYGMFYFLNNNDFNQISPGYNYIVKTPRIIGALDRRDKNMAVPLYGRFFCLQDKDMIINLSRKSNLYLGEFHSFIGGRLEKSVKLDDYGSISTTYLNYKSRVPTRDNTIIVIYENMLGLTHNERGPAYIKIIGNNRDECYFLNNKELSKQEWEEQMLTKLYW